MTATDLFCSDNWSEWKDRGVIDAAVECFEKSMQRSLLPEESMALTAMLRAWHNRDGITGSGDFVNSALNLLDRVGDGNELLFHTARNILLVARELEERGNGSSGLFTRHAAVWRNVPEPEYYRFEGPLGLLPGAFRYLEEAMGGRVADEVPPAK